jgi:hypothetical protein
MIYPKATYRPLEKFSNGKTYPRIGAVLHVNDGNSPSLYDWIAGQPGNGNGGMSCHFQVATNGGVEQYLDTDYGSWAQKAGNNTYISIETQGFSTTALTVQQVIACAGLMAWLHNTHSIPLVIADHPGMPGLGWHGMGAPTWGHAVCPGEIRRDQRINIVAVAAAMILQGDDPSMSAADVAQLEKYIKQLHDDLHVTIVQEVRQAMKDELAAINKPTGKV